MPTTTEEVTPACLVRAATACGLGGTPARRLARVAPLAVPRRCLRGAPRGAKRHHAGRRGPKKPGGRAAGTREDRAHDLRYVPGADRKDHELRRDPKHEAKIALAHPDREPRGLANEELRDDAGDRA